MPAHSVTRKFLAWCVHTYTALGLLCAGMMVYEIVQGTPASFRWAFVWMLIATFVDATDGTLARLVRIKEVLPGFDGRRLDDLVDWLTYTCIPLFLLWKADIPQAGGGWLLFVPLFAGAYGFCQVSIKTDDGFFLGFPSYWNLVAFYLYALQPLPDWISIFLIVLLSVLTFVPLRYLYPSQGGRLNTITNGLGAIWACALLWIIWTLPVEETSDNNRLPVLLSLVFPVYYMTVSWFLSWCAWRK